MQHRHEPCSLRRWQQTDIETLQVWSPLTHLTAMSHSHCSMVVRGEQMQRMTRDMGIGIRPHVPRSGRHVMVTTEDGKRAQGKNNNKWQNYARETEREEEEKSQKTKRTGRE